MEHDYFTVDNPSHDAVSLSVERWSLQLSVSETRAALSFPRVSTHCPHDFNFIGNICLPFLRDTLPLSPMSKS